MKALDRVSKFQLNKTIKSLIIFMLIVLILNIYMHFVNSTERFIPMGSIEYGSDVERISVVSQNNVFIIIFFIIQSFKMIYERLILSISFSISRVDFIKTIILENILIASIISVFQFLLFKIEPFLIMGNKYAERYDFGYFNLQEDSFLYIIFTFFILLLFAKLLIDFVLSLNFKYGAIIWVIFIILFLIGVDTFHFKRDTEIIIGIKNIFADMGFDNKYTIISYVKCIFLSIILYLGLNISIKSIEI